MEYQDLPISLLNQVYEEKNSDFKLTIIKRLFSNGPNKKP